MLYCYYKALHTGQPCYLADLIDSYEPSRCLRSTNCHLLAVPFCVKSSFASRAFCISSPGILSFCTSAHLTVLSLSIPALNLTFSLLPITSSHPHASASDSTFDYWRYINIWLTFDIDIMMVLTYFNRTLLMWLHQATTFYEAWRMCLLPLWSTRMERSTQWTPICHQRGNF